MLQNAYFLAKISADTAENEQHFSAGKPGSAADRGAVVRSADRVAHRPSQTSNRLRAIERFAGHDRLVAEGDDGEDGAGMLPRVRADEALCAERRSFQARNRSGIPGDVLDLFFC